MKLTKGFEVAACIILLLSTQDPNIPLSSAEINNRLKGSPTYLRKIVRKLVVSKLVNSVSGNNGGFTLAIPAKEINLLQVVEAVEGPVQTYYDSGLIDQVFREYDPSQGIVILKNAFASADALWCNYLRNTSVYAMILEALGEEQIDSFNWNQSGEKRELLIRKVMKSIHGND